MAFSIRVQNGRIEYELEIFFWDDRVRERYVLGICDVLCSSGVYKRFKVDLAHTFFLHARSII